MNHILNEIRDYILVVNYQGEIQYCNDKLLLRLNYNKDDIYNFSINNILLTQDFNIKDLLRNKNKGKIELKLYSKSKNIINLSSKVILDIYNNKESIFIVAKELTDKYYTKEDLEILLDEVPFMTWIKDIKGRYIYANKSYLEYTKQEKHKIQGKYDRDIWDYKRALVYEQEDKLILQSRKPILYEEKILSDKRNEYFEIFKSQIIGVNGSTKYLIGTSKNITVRKNLELDRSKGHNDMSALYGILNKNNKNTNLYKMLQDMMKDLSRHLEVDGMVLLLNDAKRELIVPIVKLGIGNITFENQNNIKFSKDELNKYIKEENQEGICHINNRYKVFNKEKLINNGIEYTGVYNITTDEEFIGILSISYKNKNLPMNNLDSFMKTIAMEIGILIKKYRLSGEVKKELEKRRDVENELELFLKTATDIMGIVNKDGWIKKVNYQWSKTLGWSCEELLSMNMASLIHIDDLDAGMNVPKAKNKEEIIRLNQRCLCKDGEYKWLEFSSILIGETEEFVVTARDITEEKIREEERKSLEEAIHLESIKNEFFANISHEFKTPINIILGTMQLLNKKIDKNEIYSKKNVNLNKYVNSIKQNSYRLLRLVNNLIDMTRIDTGFYKLQLSNYNIVQIIEDISMSVINYTENKHINIIFDTDREETVIACDPDKIERIVLNILSNAVKYTDKNGEIIVDIKHKDNKVIVSIKDNGVGISKEKLGLIFERFEQVNHSLTRRCEGSGIGLSLTKSLIEMHKGEIYVNSEEGVGSEFIFELPIVTVEEEHKTIPDGNYSDFQIEKCNIEFSDIYSL
ncbi:ATP-binding protein [Clostridium sp. CCUG 7971]|uniref:PAS domain-containing sensor histidine kinase n=1 Tax=Clostridium sp. CCUG 7971 TaxID=2811414 RepID=UPI001ABB5D5B|nr:ATP-binding protein [Clostridium sp. CCUG 7971]MBO3443819.1 PAS domain S-box protein [Clostridium sp. CCUG 7971]